jgi:hypothetical protein
MNYSMKGKAAPAAKKKMGMPPKAKMAKGGMVKGGKCPKCGKSKPCMACGGMAKGKK